MTGSTMSGSIESRRLSRRRFVAQAGGIAAGAALASSHSGPLFHRANAQEASGFTREASITSWGFGAEETNPMAFSRIDAFRQAYPNVELELVPEFDDQKLLTGFASEQLPDLLWMDRFQIASWASRGVLAPLDDMIAAAGIDTSKYYPAALDEVTYEGKIYAIPQFIDVRALYVNLDALAEAGVDPATLDTSNWDQLSQLGAQLVKANGDQVERWGFDHKMQADHLWLWGEGNGGKFMNEDATEATFDDPKVVEALAWGKTAYDNQGGFQNYEAFATTWQGDEQFARAQVAMTVYEHWMLGILARVAPELNFQVFPIQAKGAQGQYVSFAGGPAWTIPNGAKDPEAAFEFIKFMDSIDTWRAGATGVKSFQEENGRPYTPTLTAIPEANQMQIDEFYQPLGGALDAAVQLFPQILEQSFIRPVSKSPAGKQLQDILKQDGIMPALRGERSPEDALKNADEEAQSAIDAL
jgi:multiple sugar transport system substrate-binding protein